MAFDSYTQERINRALHKLNVEYYNKKMMGGLVYMVNGKMLAGTHIDKRVDKELLMLRVGLDQAEVHLTKEHVLPMDFTGRPMKGYIFVLPDGVDTEDDLIYYLQLALDFNTKLLKL